MLDKQFTLPAWASPEPVSLGIFKVYRKQSQVATVSLSSHAVTTFGRSVTNHVVVEHPSVSREHAVVISGSADGSAPCSIIDLHSVNGTYLLNPTTQQFEPIPSGTPVPLPVASQVVFGKGTKAFVLSVPNWRPTPAPSHTAMPETLSKRPVEGADAEGSAPKRQRVAPAPSSYTNASFGSEAMKEKFFKLAGAGKHYHKPAKAQGAAAEPPPGAVDYAKVSDDLTNQYITGLKYNFAGSRGIGF